MQTDKVFYTMTPTTRRLMITVPLLFVGILLWTMVEGGIARTLVRLGPFLAVGSIVGYSVYRVAHTIVVRENEACIEFRSFLGTRVIPVVKIVAVRRSILQPGQVIVRHAHGSVAMPAQFEGLHEILEWIRRQNTNVDLNRV